MYVRRPSTSTPIRRADEEIIAGEEVAHILTTGSASAHDYGLLTEAERRSERRRLREALARKRPPGFTADWSKEEDL